MQILIDTSNKKFISALIKDKKVIDLFQVNTNQDVVKNANLWIEKLLKKNNIKLKDINNVYITIGPGSFTGVKVALNISSSLFIENMDKKINVIDSFDFQRENQLLSAIQITKNKFLVKNYKTMKIEEYADIENLKDVCFNTKITKIHIEKKINVGFTKIKLNEVKLIYWGENK